MKTTKGKAARMVGGALDERRNCKPVVVVPVEINSNGCQWLGSFAWLMYLGKVLNWVPIELPTSCLHDAGQFESVSK